LAIQPFGSENGISRVSVHLRNFSGYGYDGAPSEDHPSVASIKTALSCHDISRLNVPPRLAQLYL
jgi:hypothetical protein